jgi:TrmH family RNA methyltransferase
MISIARLARLAPGHRRRKAALLLEELERSALAGFLPRGLPGSASPGAAQSYIASLAELLASDYEGPAGVRESAEAAAVLARGMTEGAAEGGAMREADLSRASVYAGKAPTSAEGVLPPLLLRSIDSLRHALLSAEGRACADWDLIDPSTGKRDVGARTVVPGLRVYLEDIRSPFNVGTIFRTAEAFGIEEILLSPGAADPRHPRAARSSMGTVELLRWRRSGLEALEEYGPAFALELGGLELDEFPFPERGVVVIGSEELGVSPEALKACALGKVSIPMSGAKASLNVAVAFGILVRHWQTDSTRRRQAAEGGQFL